MLTLRDFRNYAEATVEFAPGLNLVVGRNGQGKTNLLEAVNVACGLGSHRSARAEAMVGLGAERAIVSASGATAGREVRLDVEVRRTGGSRMLVNRVAVDRSSPVPLVAVSFSPDDLVVVKGGPEERRRLLDQAAMRLRPLAAAQRQEFEQVLRQRTGLLKAAPTSPRALATLDVWDESFARTGAVVVRNRLAVLERLSPATARRYRSLAGSPGAQAAGRAPSGSAGGASVSGPEVTLVYEASWATPAPAGEEEIRSALLEALARARPRDLERGVSTVGPHRDDLAIGLDGADARLYASQGEQRSLALSLRMAERDLVAEERGEDPILLLDDMFSELDDTRREHLVAMVASSGQTIATATSGAMWPGSVARVLTVDAAKVVIDG